MAPTTTPVTAAIRAEMGRQRITCLALSQRAEISNATLSRKLRDLSPLSVLDLAKIAYALGVTVESLLADDRAAGAA